ncbi:conjugal transfer protein TraI [Daejeonella sp. JGW-45]|uniref:conjugal transfer protein TraI n=1 Tax=Daejeonella sp. JGW-45 TaxID=3034148 RepID=UPI0023EAC876|nr:conjugal transfer protein TraI [Daejeonella sp. JGW-45]
MKSIKIIVVLAALTVFSPLQRANAQVGILEVIRAGVKKAIKAVDLKIQRMQNETIWLQNAQKVLENELSKLKLTEIAGWTEKQRELYREYYEELWKVKAAISYYQRIRDITKKQGALVEEYRHAYNLFRKDQHFKPGELDYMEKVYSGILTASVKNLDQILLIVNSFNTQMSDAKRLELINAAADRIDENYSDLRQFNNQNIMLSLTRAKSERDIQQTRRFYGIEN